MLRKNSNLAEENKAKNTKRRKSLDKNEKEDNLVTLKKFITEKRKSYILNKEFKKIDLKLLNSKQQMAYKLLENHLKNTKSFQFKMIILGSAGTGKTLLIQALCQLLRTKKVKHYVASFTASAAKNIVGAATIHSTFKFPQFYCGDKPNDLMPLARKHLRGTKFVIIDEAGMLGLSLFSLMNDRLCNVFENNEEFGRVSFILVLDIFQLGPVADFPLYKEFLSTEQIPTSSKIYKNIDKAIILTEQMRQLGPDQEFFRNILERMKKGQINQSDIDILNKRVIKRLGDEELELFSDAVTICADKNISSEINK